MPVLYCTTSIVARRDPIPSTSQDSGKDWGKVMLCMGLMWTCALWPWHSRMIPCCQHTASPVPCHLPGAGHGKLPFPPHCPGMLSAGLVATWLRDAGVLRVAGSSHPAWLHSAPGALLVSFEQKLCSPSFLPFFLPPFLSLPPSLPSCSTTRQAAGWLPSGTCISCRGWWPPSCPPSRGAGGDLWACGGRHFPQRDGLSLPWDMGQHRVRVSKRDQY